MSAFGPTLVLCLIGFIGGTSQGLGATLGWLRINLVTKIIERIRAIPASKNISVSVTAIVTIGLDPYMKCC